MAVAWLTPAVCRIFASAAVAVLAQALGGAPAVACTGGPPASAELAALHKAWRLESAHALIGQVMVARGGLLAHHAPAACPPHTPIEALALLLRAGEARFVLLGEVHDNARHHELRAKLLEPLAMQPALVMEHIRADQQGALDQFEELRRDAEARGQVADFFRFLDWESSGWPDKTMFEPIIARALAAKLPILPGDAARETVRTVARGGGIAVLPEDERRRLRLDLPLPASLADALAAELKSSHCDMLPMAALPGMAAAQRYRDAVLADAMVRAAGKYGAALLLAGNGHLRIDRAVPYYLRQMVPDKSAVTVMLLEVEDGKTDPAAYIARDPAGSPAVDYIVFTPRATREDPCAAMRRHMEGKGRK